MFTFKTTVDLDLLDLCPEAQSVDRLAECVSQTVLVTWTLEFETRDWGVKEICLHAPNQEIHFTIEILKGDEVKEHEITAKVSDVQIETPLMFDIICPKTLQFFRGQWMLEF